MNRKIVLISSSFEEVCLLTAKRDSKQGSRQDNTHYSLGLAYLHSYLESQNNLVETLFLNHYSFEECFKVTVDKILSFRPDIVGFQMFSSNRVSTYRLIEYIHEKFPNIQLIAGGIHATIMHRQLLEKYPFLKIVLGEGEITLSSLVNRLSEKNPDLSTIDGIAFMKNKSIVITKPRELIDNLDSLPFPKHEIFLNNNSRWFCIITTRGCPFSCSFCSLDSISRRKVRKRSIGNIISELKSLISKYPDIPMAWIHDDSFFIDNKRVIEFCDEVIRHKIKIDFVCSARFKPLSEEMVKKLEEANFKLILFGLESGDEKILHSCHKGITQKDVLRAFNLFKHSKIEIYPFLIIGLPGENLSTINETASFIRRLQKIKYVHYSDMALLTIYPGTEIYEIAKSGGIISDDFWLSDAPTPLFTLENSFDRLIEFKEILYNRISFSRFFTWKGLRSQFFMLPHILKYIFCGKNKKERLINFFSPLARNLIPISLYDFLKKILKH